MKNVTCNNGFAIVSKTRLLIQLNTSSGRYNEFYVQVSSSNVYAHYTTRHLFKRWKLRNNVLLPTTILLINSQFRDSEALLTTLDSVK